MPVDIYNDSNNSISGEASAAEQLRKLRNMKQEEDARKAMQLDQLVKARIAEQEAARQEALRKEAMESGMAASLNRLIDAGVYKPPVQQPDIPYVVGKDGVPVPADQIMPVDQNRTDLNNTGLAERYRK